MNSIIQLDGVSKWFGEVIGLNGVTVSIRPGITGLLGHNGAGKTTFLSLVTGQLKPSMGRVRVLGRRPWNNPRVLSRVGYCPETDTFWRGMSGRDFVSLLGRISGYAGSEADRRAEGLLDRVGMADHAHRPVHEYSRGMRQRVKIAQALLNDPELLVLDEPLAGMDPVVRADINRLLLRLCGEGVHIVISSHVLHEVQAITDTFLLIDHGCLIAEGDVHEVRALLEERAHRIVFRTDSPRRLAELLILREYTAGVDLPRDGELVVRTFDPERFFDELPRLLIDHGVACTEIDSQDDNLEAVFSYLTEHTV